MSGVMSGILTEIIYNILSSSTYEIVERDGVYMCEAIPRISDWGAIVIVLITFFSVWFFIASVCPKIAHRCRTLIHHKPPVYDENDVLTMYNESLLKIREIYTAIYHAQNLSSVVLYSREFLACIVNMAKIFANEDEDTLSIVLSHFRTVASLNTVSEHISKYEYFELLDTADKIICILRVHDDGQHGLSKDLDNASSLISDMRNIFNNK